MYYIRYKSIFNQLKKTNASNLENPSKLIDCNLVSNKKTSAELDSFRVMTEEPGKDQIYFSISDSDENSLMDDTQSIPDSRQVGTVPPINTSISHISTEFVTESLCGSINKEKNLTRLLNTVTPQ